MSPISSRNRVPSSACSKRPRRRACAPVKAPRSWPKSSDSRRSFGIAAVFIAMNGLSARGLWRCNARATSSLPVPDSPVIRTVAPDCAEHLLHRLCLAEDVRRTGRRLLGFILPHALAERAADELDRLVNVEWLGQIFERTTLERRHRRLQIGVGGHDNDRKIGETLL